MGNLHPKDLAWRELCRQASEEHDSDRLIELVRQLNQVLEDQRKQPHDPQQGRTDSFPEYQFGAGARACVSASQVPSL